MVTPDTVSTARSHGLADLLRRSATRFPDKTALVTPDTALTFDKLDGLVDHVAAALDERGLHKGGRLAILSRNNWQFVVAAYAAARCGVLLVPINFMLTAEEVAYILEHSQADGIIAGEEFCGTAQAALAQIERTVHARAVIGDSSGVAGDSWENFDDWSLTAGAAPQVAVADDEPIRIMYTSGTESRPKGVLLSSRSLVHSYLSVIVGGEMCAEDIDLHTMPLYHCAQLDCFLGPDIYLGATSVVLPKPDPVAILTAIERHGVTKFFAPPTVWISLLRSPRFSDFDLTSLRKGYYGASSMPIEVLNEIRTRLPELRLWNLYGQTEMSPVATILGPEEQESKAGSAGYPALNVETAVVDEAGSSVPPGTVGEIVHRSPHLTLGYWRDDLKTVEAFRDGWFHSGDLGFFDDDGCLTVVDRKKDMIKTGGENVASREVEEVIYQHPGVAEVAVFGVPHPKWIEAVCAAVVPRQGATLDEETVAAHCSGRLAGFQTPKHVFIVETLPKNPSGKILKRELRNTFSALLNHPE
ncbi:fatty acyl-CoA synthetase [Mycolicibacterium thermoresistibile]|uniref:Long-chain-fatty-acid--CoA ligase FadD13 n=2 Tax=Mycolicibacterium thermoresistibile TaxID=1797 RepID=G7CJW8_MYCT3|nr:fatty acyl-CoA synthetase [Mycolicibacterium thermoresistibile]EHI12836.1 acyl-CoA synthetase [Mycolicibacterium thermoresistibile ATCC 19527]MCV7189908.1 AMP-binding protein [Mycolicibacterium thermoresistibile]GAT14040.1 acyl-CoA synthetase [Mycolicibacterium thermoresistibile]SNW19212.1 acyl-CoA synthetase [Mycolicibacterium thermoresistibile]